MKVRCSYCKAVFAVEALKGLWCPQCGRVVILPSAARPKSKCVRHEHQQERLKIAMDWTSRLVLAQRPLFMITLAMATIVGSVCLMFRGGCAPPPPLSVGLFQRKIAVRELRVLQTGLARFAMDCKRYPDELENLPALLDNPGLQGWRGPYVTLLKNDPWGRWYVYQPGASNETGVVFSAGPDALEGTDDDIPAPTVSPDDIRSWGEGVSKPVEGGL